MKSRGPGELLLLQEVSVQLLTASERALHSVQTSEMPLE